MSGGAAQAAARPSGLYPQGWRAYQREAARGATISSPDLCGGLVHLVVSGWACRSKLLADGRRQILGLLLPGELCGLRERAAASRGVAVCAITPCRLLVVPREEVLREIDQDLALSNALWGAMARQDAIIDDFIVSLGRRSGVERLAHLMCDLLQRQSATGATGGAGASDHTPKDQAVQDNAIQDRARQDGARQERTCELALTQLDLSDLVGLSVVHVNRSLQTLRRSGLIQLERGRLTVLDFPALSNLALFDPA